MDKSSVKVKFYSVLGAPVYRANAFDVYILFQSKTKVAQNDFKISNKSV